VARRPRITSPIAAATDALVIEPVTPVDSTASRRRRASLWAAICSRRSLALQVGSARSRIAAASVTSPGPVSVTIDTCDRKLRTGKRLYSGFGPSCTTLQSSGTGWASGIHGARLSTTSTTSASASHGPGSGPTFIGCPDGTAVATFHQWHTGIANDSAISDRAANPACVPAPRWATISGRSAWVSSQAARWMASGLGAISAGAIAGGAASASGGHGSHNTSRGRLRYTGPFGVLLAIA
jgi:hypothetical protein